MSDTDGFEARLQRVNRLTDAALSRLDLEKLLLELLERVRELLRTDTATVLLHDPRSHQLFATAAVGIEEEVRQGVRIPIGEGFAGRVAAELRPILVDRVDDTTVINPLLWEKHLHILLGVPLVAAGQLVGVLHVGRVRKDAFTNDDIALLQVAADRIALAVQAESSVADRAPAAALQRSLLPSVLPEVAGLEFAARYLPGEKNGVGGDWYDVFPLDGERVGIVIGDVVGRGLEAAVVMGRLRSALRAYALDSDDPAEVLRKLDRKATHFEQDIIATVAYAVLDPSHEWFRLALAGHLPPVIAEPDKPGFVLDIPPDPPIGSGIVIRPRRAHVIPFPPGATVCFYTDGLIERRDESIDRGLTKLSAALHSGPARTTCGNVVAAMVGNRTTQDDVAVLVMRRDPA